MENQLLETILTSIGDAVVATDDKGLVDFMNPEAERLTGWSQSDAKGLPLPQIFRIINETSRRPVENPVGRVIATGVVVGLANHTVLISKQGVEVPIDDSAAPIRKDGGPLLGVVLVFRDVTAQRLAQRATAHLAAIAEHSGDVILTKNLQGIIQTWNASAERLFGYTASEIIGKPATTLFPPDRLNEEDYILTSLHNGCAVERLETIRLTMNFTFVR